MNVFEASPPGMAKELARMSTASLAFFHKQGCSPCADVMPHVRDVAGRFPALHVYLVDVTNGSEGVHGYTNGGTPLVVLFDERGLEVWRWRGGSVTADKMATVIEEEL